MIIRFLRSKRAKNHQQKIPRVCPMCALTFYYLYVCLLFDLIAPECCFILLSMYYLDATCFFFFGILPASSRFCFARFLHSVHSFPFSLNILAAWLMEAGFHFDSKSMLLKLILYCLYLLMGQKTRGETSTRDKLRMSIINGDYCFGTQIIKLTNL